MKKSHIIKFCAVLALIFAVALIAAAQGKQKNKTSAPQTVTDFYLLLPAKYFPFFDRVKNRRDLIESENIETGYLNFVGNRAAMPLDNEMLLLKRTSGTSILAIAYTDCFAGNCEAVLRFAEYENGRWSEVDAAPKFDPSAIREIYRRKTGQTAKEKPYILYSLSPTDKSLTVKISGEREVEIYKLQWDGNTYGFAAPN
jgi:hypothetical protein